MAMTREHKTQDSVECNRVTSREIGACMAIRYSVFTLHNMFKITMQVYMCGGLVVGSSTDALLVYNCCHYQLLGGDLHKFCRVLTAHQSCSKLLESV